MQKKVYRVERMFAGGRTAKKHDGDQLHDDMVAELNALRALADRNADDREASELQRELAAMHHMIGRNLRELEALRGPAGEERRMSRAASELGAAIGSMEKATQKILHSTETIDESARALCATLRDNYKRGLAQEIQDHVMHIYEACNFQDLTGQRIGKAMMTLKMVEEQIGRMIDNASGAEHAVPQSTPALQTAGRKLVNGPMLDGDSGHVDQTEVDLMFA